MPCSCPHGCSGGSKPHLSTPGGQKVNERVRSVRGALARQLGESLLCVILASAHHPLQASVQMWDFWEVPREECDEEWACGAQHWCPVAVCQAIAALWAGQYSRKDVPLGPVAVRSAFGV